MKTSFLHKVIRRLVGYYLNLFSFEFYQRNGFHVMRKHYYSPIPDTSELSKQVFSRKFDLADINIREPEQIKLVKQLALKYRNEYDLFPEKQSEKSYIFHTGQTSFRCVDAQILYSLLREFKPRRMIEVGSGYSTMLSAQALLANFNERNDYKCEFTAIEPFPNENIKNGFPGLTSLIESPVQQVQKNIFSELTENDVLFLDSSHTVKINGDVNFEILEILPILKKGVLVHFHDIFLPYEYPSSWFLAGNRFWAEQYLLHAFLLHNKDFEILWMSHFMHRNHSELLASSMKYYQAETPFVSSFWLRKIN